MIKIKKLKKSQGMKLKIIYRFKNGGGKIQKKLLTAN